MKFEFMDFDITLREILFSIIILCLVICFGLFINNRIDDYFIKKEEKYNKALKVNNNNELFEYSIKTNVGNLINYGEFEAIDPVKDDWLINSYTAYNKITERYTKHTRTVCSSCGKTTCCHTETYHTWDKINNNLHGVSYIKFSGVNFFYSDFTNYPWKTLSISRQTINNGIGYLKDNYIYEKNKLFDSEGDIRYYYEIIPTHFYGTTFGVAKDNVYKSEDNRGIYIDSDNLENYIKKNKNSRTFWKVLFWVIYLILVGLGIYGFYYIDNEWLEE